MAKLHLEGMGVMGCLIAIALESEEIDFTWNDTDEGDETRLAWKVSTGAILPFGDHESQLALKMWTDALEGDSFLGKWLQGNVIQSTFCYVSQNPPHNGAKFGIKAEAEVGGVKISNAYGWNMDVQTVVRNTRLYFHDKRRESAPKRSVTIVTHGFGPNIYKWSWGWSGLVHVRFTGTFLRHKAMRRRPPLMYMRQGYQLPYLYKVGRRAADLFYCGTTLITQSKPRSLPIEPKYETWEKNMMRAAGGVIDEISLVPGSLKEGWRPMADPAQELVEADSNGFVVKPQYGNGIRMFPLTYAELRDAIDGVLD